MESVMKKINHIVNKTDNVLKRKISKNKEHHLEKTSRLTKQMANQLYVKDLYYQKLYGKTYPIDRINRLKSEMERIKEYLWILGYASDIRYEVTNDEKIIFRIFIF